MRRRLPSTLVKRRCIYSLHFHPLPYPFLSVRSKLRDHSSIFQPQRHYLTFSPHVRALVIPRARVRLERRTCTDNVVVRDTRLTARAVTIFGSATCRVTWADLRSVLLSNRCLFESDRFPPLSSRDATTGRSLSRRREINRSRNSLPRDFLVSVALSQICYVTNGISGAISPIMSLDTTASAEFSRSFE